MLARPCLSDHLRLAHPLREERLADHIVEFVAAGVRQIFPLQQKLNAEFGGEAVASGHRCRPTSIFDQGSVIFSEEFWVSPCLSKGSLKFHAGRHQRFWNKPASVFAETALGPRVSHQ